MDTIPLYVPIIFSLTALATMAVLLHAGKTVGVSALPSKILFFLLPAWLILQEVIASTGFYEDATSVPPRLFLFGVLPAIVLIILYFVFFRSGFIEQLSLRSLTLLHVVRIPVEIVLLLLFMGGQIPKMMTFEGRNFDILSGVLAPIVYFIAFRSQTPKRWLLVTYNIIGLLLLVNIVSIAALSLPSPIQQLNFDQPNRAVLYFPYIWLPAVVVPIVLFSHLASLWNLSRGGRA